MMTGPGLRDEIAPTDRLEGGIEGTGEGVGAGEDQGAARLLDPLLKALDGLGIEDLVAPLPEDNEIIAVPFGSEAGQLEGDRMLRGSENPRLVLAVMDDGVDLELLIPSEGAEEESGVPVRFAFEGEDADLLVDDVDVDGGAVVGTVDLPGQGLHLDAVFELAGGGFGDLELDRDLGFLAYGEVAGLDG